VKNTPLGLCIDDKVGRGILGPAGVHVAIVITREEVVTVKKLGCIRREDTD